MPLSAPLALQLWAAAGVRGAEGTRQDQLRRPLLSTRQLHPHSPPPPPSPHACHARMASELQQKHGVRILLGHAASSIVELNPGATPPPPPPAPAAAAAAATRYVVTCTSATTTTTSTPGSSSSSRIAAAAVVVALPPTLWRELSFEPPLPASKLDVASRMFMASAVKTVAVFEEAFWKLQGGGQGQGGGGSTGSGRGGGAPPAPLETLGPVANLFPTKARPPGGLPGGLPGCPAGLWGLACAVLLQRVCMHASMPARRAWMRVQEEDTCARTHTCAPAQARARLH